MISGNGMQQGKPWNFVHTLETQGGLGEMLRAHILTHMVYRLCRQLMRC